MGKESDGEGVGLWVVGGDEREEGRFAGAVGAENTPARTAADGPFEAMASLTVDGFLPVAENGFRAVFDDDIAHFDYGFTCWRGRFVFNGKAFSAVPTSLDVCVRRLPAGGTGCLSFGTLVGHM